MSRYPTWATDSQKACIRVLSAALGDVKFVAQGKGVSVMYADQLATFDTDRLTRLVFEAHRHYVRVEIRANLYVFEIFTEARDSVSRDPSKMHPTLEEAYANFCLKTKP